MSLYTLSSTTFGSTISRRTWSGVALKRMLETRLLMQTLLPEPVAPATSRWGMRARSAIRGSPEIVFPRAIGRVAEQLRNSPDSTISRR